MILLPYNHCTFCSLSTTDPVVPYLYTTARSAPFLPFSILCPFNHPRPAAILPSFSRQPFGPRVDCPLLTPLAVSLRKRRVGRPRRARPPRAYHTVTAHRSAGPARRPRVRANRRAGRQTAPWQPRGTGWGGGRGITGGGDGQTCLV